MPLTDKQYEALVPTEQLAYRQMRKSDQAEERNDAKALMGLKIKDPVTALRRKPIEYQATLATRAALSAGAGAVLGALYARNSAEAGGPALGALAGAGLAAGAYLLAALYMRDAGKAVGDWDKLDKKRLKAFYDGSSPRWIYDYGYSEAQLEKLRQEATAKRQAAPTQLVF